MAVTRNAAVAIAAVAVLTAITTAGSHAVVTRVMDYRADHRAPQAAPPIPITAAPVGAPFVLTVPDCGDGLSAFPCVAQGPGGWALIFSVVPYRGDVLVPCPAEDGGPDLPCVWSVRPQRTSGEWLVYVGAMSIGTR